MTLIVTLLGAFDIGIEFLEHIDEIREGVFSLHLHEDGLEEVLAELALFKLAHYSIYMHIQYPSTMPPRLSRAKRRRRSLPESAPIGLAS